MQNNYSTEDCSAQRIKKRVRARKRPVPLRLRQRSCGREMPPAEIAVLQAAVSFPYGSRKKETGPEILLRARFFLRQALPASFLIRIAVFIPAAARAGASCSFSAASRYIWGYAVPEHTRPPTSSCSSASRSCHTSSPSGLPPCCLRLIYIAHSGGLRFHSCAVFYTFMRLVLRVEEIGTWWNRLLRY